MNICGIVCGRNEDILYPWMLKQLNMPFIAVLDNPTYKVEKASENAILKIYAERQDPDKPHVFYAGAMIKLFEQAAAKARKFGFDWVIRSDADEDWADVFDVIYQADKLGCNIVNFYIDTFKPLVEIVDTFDKKNYENVSSGDPLFVDTNSKLHKGFHRAWKIDDNFTIDHGGHIITRKDAKIFNSAYAFGHYPAVDLNYFREKLARKYAESELKKGWHIQYKNVRVEPKPKKK